MAGLSPTPKQQIFGSDGAPLVGGKIYTYLAGTSTPATTYTDFGAGTANTNPIILDSLGQANIWLLSATSYKFIVRTATDVLLYTVDNISTPLDISALAAPPPIGNTTPNTGAFTTLSASGAVTLTGLGAMKLNAGTTAERPTPSNGMIRYNTSTPSLEGYVNGAWANIPSGSVVTSVATGTGLTGGPITSTGTIAIDSTVATLTGTQTLTNKILGSGLVAGASLLTSATAVSPTGTTANFTSIPDWVKQITFMFDGLSTNGGSTIQIQFGTSAGGIETTGYISANSGGDITTGFLLAFNPASAYVQYGAIIFTKLTGNTWIQNGCSAALGIAMQPCAGSKTLSGTLDRLRLTTVNGTDTFDAGTINIVYQ